MPNNNFQQSLFLDLEELTSWKEHWENMPEFIQEDMEPFQSLIVNFETQQDRDEFAKLLDQKITYKTKSIWFPKYNREKPSSFLYISNEK